jgi:hypothetical protein
MNPYGLAALALCPILCILAHQRLQNRTARQRWLAFLLGLLLGWPYVIFIAYYFHILPEWKWMYELRSWPGSEFLVLPLALSAAAVSASISKKLRTLPLVIVTSLATLPLVKVLLNPLEDYWFQDKWRGDTCLQSTASTCGPASAATILHFLGQEAKEKPIARASYSYGGGTEAWYLARHLRSLGYKATFEFRETFNPTLPFPAIVGVKFVGTGHFIAVLEVKNGMVTYADPLRGKFTTELHKFQELYRFSGFHLIVRR